MDTEKKIESLLRQAEADGIQKKVVGAVVVFSGQKICLLKRRSDDFLGGLVELPSGTVDPGEELLDALKREIKEETNLNIKAIISFLGTFDYTSGSGKKTRQFNFKVAVDNEADLRLSEEHTAYYIINPVTDSEDYKRLNVSENTRSIISSAF